MNTASSSRSLDILPSAAMAPDDFAAHTILLPVVRTAGGAARRLEVAAGMRSRADALLAEFERVIPVPGMQPAERKSEAARALDSCLSIDLRDDMWVGRIPGGKHVLLVQEEVFRNAAERQIVEVAHRDLVEAAASRGEPVPEPILSYYRSRSAALFHRAAA